MSFLISDIIPTLQVNDELSRICVGILVYDLFIFVLQSKCPAESIDSSGRTALHYAGNFHSFVCLLLPCQIFIFFIQAINFTKLFLGLIFVIIPRHSHFAQFVTHVEFYEGISTPRIHCLPCNLEVMVANICMWPQVYPQDQMHTHTKPI